MTPVARFELVLILMSAVIVLSYWHAAALCRLPAFILVELRSRSFLERPMSSSDPDLVLVLFLPPLLMAGAYFTVWRDFHANLRSFCSWPSVR